MTEANDSSAAGSTPPSALPHDPMPSVAPASRPMSMSETRNWAMASHLSAFAGALLGGVPAFIGPLVIWLMKKDEDPYIAEHARESLNFQLFTLLVMAVAFVLTVVTLGLGLILVAPLGAAFGIAWLVFVILASVKASSGEPYRYPLTVRFIS